MRVAMLIFAGLLLLPIAFAAFCLWQGSQELFPTDEEVESARIGWAAMLALLLLLEAGTIVAIRRHLQVWT